MAEINITNAKTAWVNPMIYGILLTLPGALEKVIIPTPVLTNDCFFAEDKARHPYIYVRHLNRDKIFADLFTRLAK